MKAGGAEEQSGGAVVAIANHRRGSTDNDTISQSFFQDSANPMRGERRFNYRKRLDCWRAVCNHEIDKQVGKLGETGNDVRGGLFEKWIARAGD